MLTNVVIQRVMYRLHHSKDVVGFVYELADMIFNPDITNDLRADEKGDESVTALTPSVQSLAAIVHWAAPRASASRSCEP